MDFYQPTYLVILLDIYGFLSPVNFLGHVTCQCY